MTDQRRDTSEEKTFETALDVQTNRALRLIFGQNTLFSRQLLFYSSKNVFECWPFPASFPSILGEFLRKIVCKKYQFSISRDSNSWPFDNESLLPEPLNQGSGPCPKDFRQSFLTLTIVDFFRSTMPLIMW